MIIEAKRHFLEPSDVWTHSFRKHFRRVIHSYLIVTFQNLLEVVGLTGMGYPSHEFERCANTLLLLGRTFDWNPDIAISVKHIFYVLSTERSWDELFIDSPERLFPHWAE